MGGKEILSGVWGVVLPAVTVSGVRLEEGPAMSLLEKEGPWGVSPPPGVRGVRRSRVHPESLGRLLMDGVPGGAPVGTTRGTPELRWMGLENSGSFNGSGDTEALTGCVVRSSEEGALEP